MNVRVLHIATSFSGGAGIAARRIVEAQRIVGLESKLVAISHEGHSAKDHEYPIHRTPQSSLASKALTLFQSNLVQKSDKLVTPLSLSLYEAINTHQEGADIINIHSTYNILRPTNLLTMMKGTPIVLTLHDQRMFTGGCHYSDGCMGFKGTCSKCPQVKRFFRPLPRFVLERHIQEWKGAANFSVVCPSLWLKEMCQLSQLFRNTNISIIPNPIPFHSDISTSSTHISKNHDVLNIGFIAKNLENPFKGLNTLIRAAEDTARSRKISLHLFGEGNLPIVKGGIEMNRSVFSTDAQRVDALKTCDLVVVASTQDNSPNVVGECLVLGIPVITTRTGGLIEAAEEFSLPTFQPNDWRELSILLRNFKKNQLHPEVIQRAQNKFSMKECGYRYAATYKSILNVE